MKTILFTIAFKRILGNKFNKKSARYIPKPIKHCGEKLKKT